MNSGYIHFIGPVSNSNFFNMIKNIVDDKYSKSFSVDYIEDKKDEFGELFLDLVPKSDMVLDGYKFSFYRAANYDASSHKEIHLYDNKFEYERMLDRWQDWFMSRIRWHLHDRYNAMFTEIHAKGIEAPTPKIKNHARFLDSLLEEYGENFSTIEFILNFIPQEMLMISG